MQAIRDAVMIGKTVDPERVFLFYCDKDSLMGGGLFERAIASEEV